MPEDAIYLELQRELDRMPVGFPATSSGVEIRILRQLFSPEEARITLCLSMRPEPVGPIHRRLGGEVTIEALTSALESMAFRGLIQIDKSGREHRYGRLPFVVGIYEGQVDRMTPELARDLVEYFESGLGQAVRPKTTPQLRTVPVNQPVAVERGIARYDDIRELVRESHGPFGVMNCICRQAKDLAGEPCRQTAVRENCLTIGSAAVLMHEHGQARLILRERMLELLDEADREGLVLQPQNTRKPQFICLCCGCCCVALGAAKQLPRPVEFFAANFFAEVNGGECQACGTCLERCQMNAISLPAGVAVVDLDRCMGCGLCLSTCTTGALTLRAKDRTTEPPKNTSALYSKIYRERYGTAGFAKAAAKLLAGLRV
jgi:Na+-translocating ferredoxin:NAD+ oxidoreductase subunit B